MHMHEIAYFGDKQKGLDGEQPLLCNDCSPQHHTPFRFKRHFKLRHTFMEVFEDVRIQKVTMTACINTKSNGLLLTILEM